MWNNATVLAIHNAIHKWDGIAPTELKLGTNTYKLELSVRSRCRFVVVNNIKFIEQNIYSGSDYAALAVEGSQITWAIPLGKRGSTWGRIVDGVIECPIP